MRHLRLDIRSGLPRLVLGLAMVLYGGSKSWADLNEGFTDGVTTTPITLESFNPMPVMFGAVPNGGNPGGMLQITMDGPHVQPFNDDRNYVYFDATTPANTGFNSIDFSFDIRIGPQFQSADGGSISFLDTAIFGSTGGLATSAFNVPEDPRQVGVLGIGFDTWSNTDVGDLGPATGHAEGNSAYNDITLYYNAQPINQYVNPTAAMRDILPNGVRIDDDLWHTVEGTFDFVTDTVSMTITDAGGTPQNVWDNAAVPGLRPFAPRVMVGARTGGENENFLLDNLVVNYTDPVEIEAPQPVDPQPEPTEGNWSVREWNIVLPPVATLNLARAVIASPNFQNTTFVTDGMRQMINLHDPDTGGGGTFHNAGPLAKQPIVSDTAGLDDDDVVMRARAKVIIPADGQYTFGFDGDDGARLMLEGANFTLQASLPNAGGYTGTASGEVIEYAQTTGRSQTLASTFLTAGEHDIEVIWFERAVGASIEVFASPGIDNAVNLGSDGFAPIGLTEEIVLAQGRLPTTTGDWNVRSVNVADARPLNNLADAQAAIDLDDFDPDVTFALDLPYDVVNLHDPDTVPAGATGLGRFTPDEPFPVDEIGVDDNDIATMATVTVSITEENDYIFGFGSDDGAALTLEGADFTILSTTNPDVAMVTNNGETMEFNANTGNSDTFGWTHLMPGEYDLSFLTWERGGGAWAEVYTGVGNSVLNFLSTARLLGSPEEIFDLVVPVGLQLAGEEPPVDEITGDYSGNGLVEQADLDLVLSNWGSDTVPATWVSDLPEGFVDQAELDKVLTNWGSQGALGNAGSVPEPSTIGLLLVLAGLGLGLRRRR